ncbi:hypothetical protein BGW36DRAFT_298884 [Talaromyces proteolyticus]|uniref:GDP-mannose transporter n=1 Tax=Talaromyces proteolyticus TaxID=1131652 RepID=A0AAD4PUN8_9EURO|nr:uncharacterized protein BGW36DRAFT_298884 [Talaromyces proteolyticus]KAH8695306.1 hypothetical protein BGW36DRAFT_298884 [Talaromyces proteolyticus]
MMNTVSLTNNSILSVLAYCGSSILMTVMNKYVLSGSSFNLNIFLLFVQSTICIVAIQTCKSTGFITYQELNAEKAKKWFPVTLLLICMIYTGSKALQFLSIPVYTIFKNLSIIATAYGEVRWFGGSVSGLTLISFGLMVLSSIVAAWADITHTLDSSDDTFAKVPVLNSGYTWVLINCICTSLYVLAKRKRIKLTNFRDIDTMFYDNLLSIPVLLSLTMVIDDWSSENINKNFPLAERHAIIIVMVLSGLSSILISYTSAWCIRATSSTTYSMVGALNKLPIAVSGLVFFDVPVTYPSISAIALGFISGILYAVAKTQQNSQSGTGVLPTSNRHIRDSGEKTKNSIQV